MRHTNERRTRPFARWLIEARPLRRGLFLLACALTVACGGDDKGGGGDTSGGDTSDAEVTGASPTIAITSPVGGATFAVGETIELIANTTQAGADLSKIEVTWTTDLGTAPLAVINADAQGRSTANVTLVAGTHKLTATAVDASGRAGSASVTVVVDAPPSAPVVRITPASPKTADELEAIIDTAAVDPSGDAVTVSYKWLKNGAEAGLQTAKVPADRTARGETWKVVVQAQDGAGNSVSATAEVVIGNTAPTCGSALVLPSAGDTEDRFTCSCSDRDDADGDEAADTCEFLIGGVAIERTDTGCELDPAKTTRGMNLVCRLTPRDDEAGGEAIDSTAVSVLNAAPSAPQVMLAPVEAAIVDASGELACDVTVEGVDPDGDPVSHTVGWTVNGVPAMLVSAPETPASAATVRAGSLWATLTGGARAARRGDEIRCVVRASDGTDSSSAVSSTALVLENAPPLIGNVLVTGSDADLDESTVLSCITASATDADLDTLTYGYAWYVDEVQVATTATLSGASFGKGDVVRCELTVNDGVETSAAVTSKNQVTIKNAPPSIASVALTPGAGKRSDTFTCTPAGWSDADGDVSGYRYAWKAVVGAQSLPLVGSAATFAAADLAPGAALSCVVTPWDGTVEGAAIESNAATIENTVPAITGVAIEPAAPVVTSTLTCAPAGFSDGDGDAPVYTYSWTRNAQSLAATSATLSGQFVEGDRLRCRVTPGDGVAEGTSLTSAEVVIGNSAPGLASVTLAPSAGSLCATYSCTAGATSDPDVADTVTVGYRWEKNGAATSGTTATFVGALAVGDTLRCFARPSDGDATGPELGSTVATADNAPPTLTSVTIAPTAPGVGTLVTCVPSGYADDCSTAAYDYRWLVDGVAVGTGATYDTADEDLGADVRCEATPKDGLVSGTALSSSTIELGPGAAVAPEVAVAVDGASATCAITKAEQWFTSPTYTYYWSVNGGAEAVGTATRSASSCDLLACRVVVADARSTLSSAVATAQAALGDGCEDGNDCTSHVCAAGGGCAAPVPETGVACVHEDLCRPLGVCDDGECVATGNVCIEEPVTAAPSTSGDNHVVAHGDGGYAVQWAQQELRTTESQDSRVNEDILTDGPTRTSFAVGAFSKPTEREDGSLFTMSLSGCVRAGHPNNSDGCTFYGNTIARDGSVAVSNLTVGHGSNQGCGGISMPTMRALELGGNRVGLMASRYVYYWSGAGSGCKGTNEGVRLIAYDGPNAGTVTALVAPTQAALDYWAVTTVPFDAAATPPYSETFEVVWVPAVNTTLYAKRFTWSGGVLTSGTQVTVVSGGAAIQSPHLASFYDGTFIVGWTSGGDAWVQRFDSDAQMIGTPFRVNDVQSGTQELGGLAAFADFGFVAVWDDSRSDGTGDYGIRAQRFDASAVPEGPAVNLNMLTVGVQNRPSVAVLTDDQWVATWYDTNLGQVMSRRFERDGMPAPGSRELLPSETRTGDQTRPRGATSKQGTTLVVWETPLYVGEDTEIGGRLLGRSALGDGRVLTEELVVNQVTASIQRAPAVAGGDDRFAVVWETLNEDGSSYGIAGRVLDAQGRPVTEAFIVNDLVAGSQSKPAVAMRPDGSFMVTWQTFVSATDTGDIRAKVYDRNGNVLVAETLINGTTLRAQERPAVTVFGTGYLVGWESFGQVDQGGYDLYMRTATVAGGALTLGGEKPVNATTAGNQRNLALGVSPSNYVAACWDSPDAGATLDVVCQTFKGASFPQVQEPEFSPAVARTGNQEGVALAYDGTGRLVVVWESEGVDVAGRAVMARHFSASGAVSGPRIELNRTQVGDQSRPFVAPVSADALWFGWQSAGQDGSGATVVTRLLSQP